MWEIATLNIEGIKEIYMRKSHRPLLEPLASPVVTGKRAILVLMPSEIRLGTDINEAACQAEDSFLLQQPYEAPNGFFPSESALKTRIRPVSLTPELGYISRSEKKRSRGISLVEKKCLTPKLQQLLDGPVTPPLPLPFLKKQVRKRKLPKAALLPPLSPYRFLEIEGISPSSAEKKPRWDLNSISPAPGTAFRRRFVRFIEEKRNLPPHESEATLYEQASP